jgi:hypothetical protein
MLSNSRPRPSVRLALPYDRKQLMNFRLMDRLPWSVLEISGFGMGRAR